MCSPITELQNDLRWKFKIHLTIFSHLNHCQLYKKSNQTYFIFRTRIIQAHTKRYFNDSSSKSRFEIQI